jgi:peroxiredoxin
MRNEKRFYLGMVLALGFVLSLGSSLWAADPWIVFEGKAGPGKGKHIVFIAGDDEYRSEELMPQFAKIAAVHHGFKSTVLFPINKETGEIDPGTLDNIPGLENLKDADLMVMFLRFRELPDEQMKCIVDFANSGKPMMSLRTNTHAFNYRKNRQSPYAKYSFNSRDPKGGFGRLVFGETWINHYGRHKVESTRGLIAKGMEEHPIVKGIDDIWGPSDVYGITTLPGDSKPIIMGQVLSGMKPTDPPNDDKKPVPVAWLKTFKGNEGKSARVFTTTMGHAHDFKNEGFRRLCINACYWLLEMDNKMPAKSKVDIVGKYDPLPIGMRQHRKGLKPSDHKLPDTVDSGRKAADFTLSTFDGKTIKLSDHRGQIVVLEWLNLECPYSKYHYATKPTMVELAKKYKDQNVVWLTINSTSHTTPQANQDFARKYKVKSLILDDRSGKTGKAYGAKTTPHMIIINAHGNIVYDGAIDNAPLGKFKGDGYVNYVDKALMEITGGKAVSTPTTKPYGCSVKYAK